MPKILWEKVFGPQNDESKWKETNRKIVKVNREEEAEVGELVMGPPIEYYLAITKERIVDGKTQTRTKYTLM